MNLRSLIEQGRMPLMVDAVMVIALFSLAFWTGSMANRIEYQGAEINAERQQINALALSNNAAEIAALKERSTDQALQISDLKDYLGGRLDRIERKLDNTR